MRRRALPLFALLATGSLWSCTQTPLATPPPAPRASARPPAPSAPPPPVARAPEVGPKGEVARIEGLRVAVSSAEESFVFQPAELHAPPGDPAHFGIAPTTLLHLDDGTLLVGASDGSVSAFDAAHARRFSIGFRGAIRGLVPASPGLVAVTTERGIMALISGEGKLRWERELTAERLGPAAVTKTGTLLVASARGIFALSPSGELVFSHAEPLRPDASLAIRLDGDELEVQSRRIRQDAAHPPIPSLEPIFPLTFHKVKSGRYGSLAARGSDELFALVDYDVGEYNDWPGKPTQALVHIVGRTTTNIDLPHRTATKEVFIPAGLPSYAMSTGTTKPDTAPVVNDAVVIGPEGNAWVLGRRLSPELTSAEEGFTGPWIGAGLVFEPDGVSVRERRDLHEHFAAHLGRGIELGKTAASPVGKAELFCFGFGEPTCALRDGPIFRLLPAPGRITRVSRIGSDDWLVSEEGKLYRRKGDDLVEVPLSIPRKVVAVAGTSEKNVWVETSTPYQVLRFDGASFHEIATPAPAAGGLFARAPDDVWADDGRAHWDGQRWSLVYGAPSAKRVLAKSRDEVWLVGDGLWRGTSKGPSPLRVAAPAADTGAPPPASAAPLGPTDARALVERQSLALERGARLTGGQAIIPASEDRVWIQAWDRLVELDAAGKATTLLASAQGGVARATVPEGRGRGLVAQGGAVRRLDQGKLLGVEGELDRRTLTAMSGNGRGAVWAVGTSTTEQRFPQALLRPSAEAAFQPVLGLPAATWSEVVATPDGGAWLSGALSPGLTGEGLLVHVRGPAGSGPSTRTRAAAALLSLSAIGNDEVWAVGAAGTIVHVRGDAVTRYVLPSGEWLRSVLAESANQVWIGGDGGTLLRFDGAQFHPVSHPLGGNATVTGIARGAGALWAVSPSGILKITQRP
jgi:hypothetical protein